MERKHTKLGNSYWDETGYYQSIYDRLQSNLVPRQGEAETLHGELIRSISRLYYDFCNNGNINSVEVETETETYPCYDCDGNGEQEVYGEDEEMEMEECENCYGSGETEEEEDGDAHITEYYHSMIELLYKNLEQNKVVAALETYLLNNYGNYSYDDKSMNIYDKVVDEVCYFCMTTENKKLKNVETFESFRRNVR
jgi:RecJ-like exonuclease